MDTNVLIPISTLREWQLILESQNPKDAAYQVGEKIYDAIVEHEVKLKSQSKKVNPLASQGLTFNQIQIGKHYRVLPSDTIRPPSIRGALFRIVEKKRTNVIGVLEEKVLGYDIGTRFNLKPTILENI